jgi:hypothetical protein
MNQLKLFGSEAPQPSPGSPSDPAYIRKSLNRLLRIARDAQIMPWGDAEAESWERLFSELAASLPSEEADVLTSDFKNELLRLRSNRHAG